MSKSNSWIARVHVISKWQAILDDNDFDIALRLCIAALLYEADLSVGPEIPTPFGALS